MARVVLGSYLVQFPVGGYVSWVLQWLVGLREQGHDVVFVERTFSPESCFDVSRGVMTSDPSYGLATVGDVLRRFGFEGRWCFVDVEGGHHGMSRSAIDEVFRTADVFIDMGTHGTWTDDAMQARIRVLIDGEPAATQIKLHKLLGAKGVVPSYDFYYTVGQNIGTEACSVPTLGRRWRHLFYPIALSLFSVEPLREDARFTTVMSWEAHDAVEWNGVTYGAKSIEFAKFIDLPNRIADQVEIAVAGRNVPFDRLRAEGWQVRDAHSATVSFDAFRDYVTQSKGEFSVCKNIFVATNSGWFGDRSGVYLASGRPVVMQETGFSRHLPCGEGLFAVKSVEEAAAAIETVRIDPLRHSRRAREIAVEYLDSKKVLGRFLAELGL